jgi:hypothetical protein
VRSTALTRLAFEAFLAVVFFAALLFAAGAFFAVVLFAVLAALAFVVFLALAAVFLPAGALRGFASAIGFFLLIAGPSPGLVHWCEPHATSRAGLRRAAHPLQPYPTHVPIHP